MCHGAAAFSKANLAILTPSALSTSTPHLKRLAALHSAVAWHPRRIVPFATTTLHVAMLLFGFGTPAVGVEAPTTVTWSSDVSLKAHRLFWGAVSQFEPRLDNGSDQTEARCRKFFFLFYSQLWVSKLGHIQMPQNVKHCA